MSLEYTLRCRFCGTESGPVSAGQDAPRVRCGHGLDNQEVLMHAVVTKGDGAMFRYQLVPATSDPRAPETRR